MKYLSRQLALWLSILAITIVLLAPINASAQNQQQNNNNAQGQALEISPPVLTLNADPGQVIKTEISLRNISGGPLIVQGQVNDFVAQGEDGTPKILLEETEENPYSFKDWVTPLTQLRLIPRQIQSLPITIQVPADASPGGHYGVVRFTATPPELEGQGVSLAASLGTLILVNVNGETTEDLEVVEFTVSKDGKSGSLFQSTPLQFMERLKNNGNTHVQPAGQITITDMFGKKVATVNVNLPPRNVLPNSIRKFDQPLDKATIGNKKLFGKYTAQLKVVYGTSKKETTSTITFWVIPYKLISILVAVVLVTFFVLRFSIRRYNRRIIAKANKTRRR